MNENEARLLEDYRPEKEAEIVEQGEVKIELPNLQEGQKIEVKEKSNAITVNEKSQLIVARDNSELYRMIQMFMKGTAFPKTIDTPEKAIAAWQVAASLNLPPMIVMQNLAFVHGSISMWGQLPKALAERTNQLEEFKIVLFDKDQKVICLQEKNLQADVWGSAVQIRRSKRSINEYFFTEEEAKTAGLFGKAGPWKQYKKIMYGRRATAHAIKFEFGDALMGVPVAEYDFNQAPDLVDVTDGTERTKTFNETLKNLGNKSTTDGVKEN